MQQIEKVTTEIEAKDDKSAWNCKIYTVTCVKQGIRTVQELKYQRYNPFGYFNLSSQPLQDFQNSLSKSSPNAHNTVLRETFHVYSCAVPMMFVIYTFAH
jgi:hypothetical protein